MKCVQLIGIILLAAACAGFAATGISEAVPGPEVLRKALDLIEQDRLDEAASLLEPVRESGSFSPLNEYLFARLAFGRGQYTEALRHLSQIMLSGCRDSEWLPAAVFLEGMIYKQTGQTEALFHVSEELRIGWPESIWGRRAAELK